MIEIATPGHRRRGRRRWARSRRSPTSCRCCRCATRSTFPDTLTPLAVGQERSIRLINDVLGGDRMLVMVASRDPEAESPGPEQLYSVGVVGTVARMLKVPDGTLRILVQAGPRVRLEAFTAEQPYLVARAVEEPDIVQRGPRADGADAQRAGDVRADHRGRPVPAGGAADRGRQHRRPVRARAPDRRRAADQDRGEAGAAGGARRRAPAPPPLRDPRARARGRRDRLADPVAGAVRAGPHAARVRAAPAAQGDPGGAGGARPDRGRGRRAARAARRDRPARGRAPPGRPRARAAGEAAAGRRRARRDPHLPGVARLAALGQDHDGQPRPRARARGARRRPLRHREGQGADPRVPRRAPPQPGRARLDPLLRRPARRRQDVAGQVDRPRARARSSSASAPAACATRPRSAATAARTSAPCRARSSGRCAMPARPTRCS